MKSYKELGNRYIKYRKKRAVLVTLSMVLATILLYAVTTVAVNYWFDRKALVEEQYNYHGEIPGLTAEQCDKVKNYATVRNADFMCIDVEQNFEDCYGYEHLEIYYMDDVNQSTYNFKLIEGELPENSTEIILDKEYLHRFKEDIKVGSVVRTTKEIAVYPEEVPEGMSETLAREKYGAPEKIEEEYSYTVVGIYDYEYHNEFVYGVTAFSKATDDMMMTAYVRFDNSVDWDSYLRTMAEDIGVDTQKMNSYVVNHLMEMFYFKGESVAYVALFLMLMVFVVYISMVMVRGLFTANLMDNITEFNILKAMGATDRKIKNIFKREIYLEGLVAFGIGVIMTHVFFFVLDKTVNVYGFNFGLQPVAVIFAFVFLYLTISLAIIEPFGVLKKVPIVEGIKSNYAINTMKDRKRAGKLFRIFGIEGEYAYKNIRRNSRSFWNGVATFTVSVLVLTVLATVLSNLSALADEENGIVGNIYEAYDYVTFMASPDNDCIEKAQYAFDNTDFIKAAEINCGFTSLTGVNKDRFVYTDELIKLREEDYDYNYDGRIIAYAFMTDNQLNRLNDYMLDGVDANVIRDGGAIVVNQGSYLDEETGEEKSIPLYHLNLGDTIYVETIDYMLEEESVMNDIDALKALRDGEIPVEEVKVEGFCRENYSGYVTIFLSYEYYVEKYGRDLSSMCNGFWLDIDEDKFEIRDMATLENVIYKEANQTDYTYANEEKMWYQITRSVKVIVICVVVFIILMGVVSILNNMVNEQQVRRREVSILRAIGMSKKKLNRMLVLERVIMGLIAWVLGTVLGVVFCKTLLVAMLYIMETSFVIPWITCLIIGASVVGIMVLISMIMVVSMGKMDITDGIRNQE